MDRTLDAKFFVCTQNKESLTKIESLIQREFCEVYIINNYRILHSLFKHFEKLILVLDFNTVEFDSDISPFLQKLIEECSEKLIQIITVDAPEKLFIHKKIINYSFDFLNKNENILKIIADLNIWGHRNYIRFGNNGSRIAFFRINLDNQWRTGVIHDISALGMSCSFDKHNEIVPNEFDTDIELCIKDKIFSLTGKFLIRRTFKNTNMFVLVFSRKKSPKTIKSLNSIIYNLTLEHTRGKIRKLV